MPFSEPIKSGSTMDIIRKLTRLTQVILDLKTEYERRPRPELLMQIKERSTELYTLSQQLETSDEKDEKKDEKKETPPALPEAK